MPNAENAVDKSRKLLGVIDQYVIKLPRDRKFTIGNRLLDRGTTILESVTEASYGPREQKAALLRKVNIQLEVLRQLLRFLFEMNVHNLHKHEYFIREIDGLGAVVGGWIKSLGATPTNA
jgi:hypothetical protein